MKSFLFFRQVLYDQADGSAALFILLTVAVTVLGAIVEFTYRTRLLPAPRSAMCEGGECPNGESCLLESLVDLHARRVLHEHSQ
ncbi:hypothetical protein [Pajaroellobacter abortibovis]|nr:hypothetical protein [Pajaroellobacter abortibovis]